MANIQLDKKITDIKNIDNPRNLKVVDVLIEARTNHNELVDAILTLNTTLNEINNKLSNLTDHQDIKDITASITFNADTISDVKDQVLPALETKMNANMKKLKADLQVKVDENKEKIVDQEGHSRRRNIIVNGLVEITGEVEDTEKVVRQFLVNDLEIDQEEVDGFLFRDTHRLPKAKNRDGTENTRPRPIIVAFLRQKDRNAVMTKAFKLKNTTYSIKTDLPKHLNDLRSRMLKERKKLKEENPTVKYRVAERSYKPVLQRENGVILGTTRIKWDNIRFPA